jgi:hypothetical protein
LGTTDQEGIDEFESAAEVLSHIIDVANGLIEQEVLARNEDLDEDDQLELEDFLFEEDGTANEDINGNYKANVISYLRDQSESKFTYGGVTVEELTSSNEYDGEATWVVYKVSIGEHVSALIRFKGYYSSYDGAEWRIDTAELVEALYRVEMYFAAPGTVKEEDENAHQLLKALVGEHGEALPVYYDSMA